MCSFIVGAFFLGVLLIGLFNGEFSDWVIFVFVVIVLSAFGRYADKVRQRKVHQEQLKYYKKHNEEE